MSRRRPARSTGRRLPLATLLSTPECSTLSPGSPTGRSRVRQRAQLAHPPTECLDAPQPGPRVRRLPPLIPDRRPDGHAMWPEPLRRLAHRPSSSRDQASRTSGSPSLRSVGSRRAASSADCHSHSAEDRRRSSADEVASAVQNVAAAPFFLLFMVIEKKKSKGQKDRVLEKKRKKKRRTHLVSPPPFDCCALDASRPRRSSFFPWRSRRRKTRVRRTGYWKKEEEEEKDSPCIPPPFDCCVLK